MARIGLERLRHSYEAKPAGDADWALKGSTSSCRRRSVRAPGPSGAARPPPEHRVRPPRPTVGRVLFGDADGAKPPDERNIAQVFRFRSSRHDDRVRQPRVPAAHRGVAEASVAARVREIAELPDPMLAARASGLTADGRRSRWPRPGPLDERDHARRAADGDRSPPQVAPARGSRSSTSGSASRWCTWHDQTEGDDRGPGRHHARGHRGAGGNAGELARAASCHLRGHFIGSPGMNILPCEVGTAGAPPASRSGPERRTRPPAGADGDRRAARVRPVRDRHSRARSARATRTPPDRGDPPRRCRIRPDDEREQTSGAARKLRHRARSCT